MTAGRPISDPEHLLREGAALRALARRLLADPSEDEDVVQEAFAEALRRRVPDAVAGRWLNVVTRRLARLRARQTKRRRWREERAARAERAPSAVEVASTAEAARRVAAAVEALDEPFRTAIVLRFWQGLPPRAIAARTGVPVNTVRSRLRRGFERLRAQLDGERGGRAGWAAPLATLASPQAAAAAAGAWMLGGLVMGTTSKLVAAGCAAAFVWWLWPQAATPTPVPGAALAGAEEQERGAAPSPEGAGAGAVDPTARRHEAADERPAAQPRLVVTGVLVDEETMAPLAGGTVRILDAFRRDARQPELEPTARSQVDGSFRVAELREEVARHAELLIGSPGRATFRVALDRDSATAGEGDGEGGRGHEVDVGRVLVPPGTGLRGTVVDAHGVPVAGADVFVSTYGLHIDSMQRHPTSILPFLLEVGTTDRGGWFTSTTRVVPHRTVETFLVASSEQGLGWSVIDVTRHRSELDERLALRPTTSLALTVLGSDDAPVAGAVVQAVPQFAPLGYPRARFRDAVGRRDRLRGLFETRTDETAIARLPALPRGEGGDWGDARAYRLVVEAAGHRRLEQDLRLEGDAVALTVHLARDRPVAVDVRVVDPAGKGIANARVSLAGRELRTDSAGRCAFDAVAVAGPELAWAVRAEGHVARSGSWRAPVAAKASFDVALEPATTLAGEVVDQHGEPVAGARVFVDASLCARSDADGRFRIDGLPDAPLQVVVLPPDPQEAWAVVSQPAPPLPAADWPARWVLEKLEPGRATLRVGVVDMVTGAPVSPEPALLHAIDARGMLAGPFVEPDDSHIGALRFDGLRPGTYRLRIANRVERTVVIAADDTDLALRVELGTPGVIEGEVAFAPGVLPETVTLMFGPDTNAARWVEPEGGRLLVREPGPHVYAAELTPARSARFRLEDADPHRPLWITAHAGLLFCRAILRVPPGGGVARPRLELAPAGRAELLFDPPCPANRLRIAFRREGDAGDPGEPWELDWMDGRERYAVQLREGRWSWWLETVPPPGAGAVAGTRREGRVEVRAGETAAIRVAL